MKPDPFPKQFLENIKQALEHLYDYPFLQRHPFLQSSVFRTSLSGQNSAQLLRQVLIDAIEKLNPGEHVYFRAPQARLYSLMQLRYVEGMMVQEAARDLGISERQAYRDLRQGEEAVATILWAIYRVDFADLNPQTVSEIPFAEESPLLPEELLNLIPNPEPTDIVSLVNHAILLVEPLAKKQHVQISKQSIEGGMICKVDQTIARQVLVQFFSRVIRTSHPGVVSVSLENRPDEPLIRFHFSPLSKEDVLDINNPVVRTLLTQLGWSVHQRTTTDVEIELILKFAHLERKLLVIDDHEGLGELLERLLTSEFIHIYSVKNGLQGIQIAKELHPDAVILDVMMAGMDGWEVLQRLKADPLTEKIPVIICSVFNDPDLALSLGARHFLPKPINPADLFNALQQVGLV